MNKLALALVGAAFSFSAAAQTNALDTTVLTTVLTVGGPVLAFTGIVVAAENNETPAAPGTTTTATTP